MIENLSGDHHLEQLAMSQPEPKAEPAPPKPKRRHRWRRPKRALVSFILLFAFSSIGYGLVWKFNRVSAQRELDPVVAKLDADDPGWRFWDIATSHNSRVEQEPNSASRVSAFAYVFPILSENSRRSVRYNSIVFGRPCNRVPSHSLWLDFDSDFAKYQHGIDHLRTWDKNVPRGRVAMSQGYPDISTYQTACFALAWDSLRASYGNDPDRALLSATAALHLIRSFDFEPRQVACAFRLTKAIEATVSVEQTLAWCPDMSETNLAALQELIHLERSSVSIPSALRGERAAAIDHLDACDRGSISLHQASPDIDALLFHESQFMPEAHLIVHKRYEKMLEISALPPGRKAVAIRESHAEWAMPTRNAYADAAMPDLTKLLSVGLEHEARCLCAEVGLACERFRIRRGRWPTSLSELKDFDIPNVPVDPCNGQPLRFRANEDGIVVYSIGENGADDGGQVQRKSATEAPDDIGFRLWNPVRRRLPITDAKPAEEPAPHP